MKKYKIYITKSKQINTQTSPIKGVKGQINDENIEYIYRSGKPCRDCVEMLIYYGIRKAIYTQNDGTLKEVKLSSLNIENQFLSDAQRKFKQDKKWLR